MAQYIDKDTLVAEIMKRFDEYSSSILKHYDACKEAKAQELGKILTILDTLEVKEVDLEEEFCNYLEKNFRIGITGMLLSNNGEPINTIKLFDFAKHFFEIGLKAKGE